MSEVGSESKLRKILNSIANITKGYSEPDQHLEKIKTFNHRIEKVFSKEMNDLARELKISKNIPTFLIPYADEPGIYIYGVASTDTIDSEGESVVISDKVISGLMKPPYNKIFMSHDSRAIASGVIKFAGRIPEMDNKFYILERANEAHPEFKNQMGSVFNRNVDTYSVSGHASTENDFDTETGKPIKIRRVNTLTEVSRTSCPANPEAMIDDMFFVKTKDGGYAYTDTEEVKKMEEFKKILEEALTPITERLDNLDKSYGEMKKTMDEAEEPKEEAKEETPAEEPKEEPTEEPKEEVKEEPEEATNTVVDNVEKIINKRMDAFEKKFGSKVEDSKAITKDETEVKFEKTKDSGFMKFITDDNKRSLY